MNIYARKFKTFWNAVKRTASKPFVNSDHFFQWTFFVIAGANAISLILAFISGLSIDAWETINYILLSLIIAILHGKLSRRDNHE